MNKIILLLICFLLSLPIVKAQSISLNGQFTDWTGTSIYTDNIADGNGVDFRGLSVTNDADNLYIRLIASAPFNFSDSNNIYLNIDADNNSGTGLPTNGIGSDFAWRCGYKYGFYYWGTTSSAKDTLFANEIKLVSLPTHKSDTFEIAINRTMMVGTPSANLFTSGTIRISFANGISGGDMIPNSGSTLSYTFTNSTPSDFGVINIYKCNSNYIRLMQYNVLNDGLKDNARLASFERIFKAINPDVIVLSECWNTTATQARTILNTWLPLPNAGSWSCGKVFSDGGNIICSRYPVQSPTQITFGRTTAAYVNLPSNYNTDLLVIGTHMAAGSNADSLRQSEADNIIQYITKMKQGITSPQIPSNTPFIIAGDFNMVNAYSPLQTLLNGNILNTTVFGIGGFPDWNNAPLSNTNNLIADRNMAYSWRNQNPKAKWVPGKLDYVLHSNTNIKVKKSFVLQTDLMSTARLTQYELQAGDNLTASDHLPTVVDFEIPTSSSLITNPQWNGSINTAWENPANWDCSTVPDKNSQVIIPSSATNFPEINLNTEVKRIQSNSNSTIVIQPNVRLIINGQ